MSAWLSPPLCPATALFLDLPVSREKGPFLSVGEFQAPCLSLNTSRKPFTTTGLAIYRGKSRQKAR